MGIFSGRSLAPVYIGGYLSGNLCHLVAKDLRLPPVTADSAEAWRAALAQLPKGPKIARLLLASDLYEVITVDRPNVEEAELVAALTWSVKDLSSIPLEHQQIDYFELKVQPAGPQKLQVVVADRRKIQPMLALLDQLKVGIELITIEEIALTNLMPNDERPHLMLCQLRDEQLSLQVSVAGEFVLQRHINGVAFAEEQDETARLMQFDALTLELQRSLDYLDRQLRMPMPASISLLLPVSLQQWMAPRIETLFELPVESIATVDRDVINCIAASVLAEEPEVKDEA